MKSIRPTMALFLLIATCGFVGCGSSPEEKLIGKWDVDMTAIKEQMKEKAGDNPGAAMALAMMDTMKLTLEFKKDKVMSFTSSMGERSQSADGTWEVVSSNGKIVTIKVEMKDPKTSKTEGDEVPLTFIDNDTVEMTPPTSANMNVDKITLKRVKE